MARSRWVITWRDDAGPFTVIIFSLELTHDFNAFLPLFIAVIIAYAFTVLMMKRSILTEKISRRGLHLSREYAIDPLEILFVREVMRTNVVMLQRDAGVDALTQNVRTADSKQRLFPIVNGNHTLAGVLTRQDLRNIEQGTVKLDAVLKRDVMTVFPHEPLRHVAYKMAETGITRMPVVERGNSRKLVGMVSLSDLLRGRARDLEEERRRERILRLRLPFGRADVQNIMPNPNHRV